MLGVRMLYFAYRRLYMAGGYLFFNYNWILICGISFYHRCGHSKLTTSNILLCVVFIAQMSHYEKFTAPHQLVLIVLQLTNFPRNHAMKELFFRNLSEVKVDSTPWLRFQKKLKKWWSDVDLQLKYCLFKTSWFTNIVKLIKYCNSFFCKRVKMMYHKN